MTVKKPSDTAVLVVEDDAAIRRLVKMVLQREGYRVDVAGDGVEAVLKLGVVEFDVIVLDLMMPNLDGYGVLAAMADELELADVPVVVVTSTEPSRVHLPPAVAVVGKHGLGAAGLAAAIAGAREATDG